MAKSIDEIHPVGIDTTLDRPVSASNSVAQRPIADTLASPDGQAVVALPMILDEQDHAPKTRSKGRIAVICLALSISLFLAALDYSIVSPALPTIAKQFDSSSGYAWIGSACFLANAATTPLWFKFSDIFGRKPALLGSVAVFFIGSLISGVAKTMAMLIFGRVVQGGASGGLMVLVTLVISDLFSLRHRNKYLAGTELVWSLAAGLGPVVGGVFTEQLSWRWCFYINLPCGGLALICLWFFLDVHTPRTPVMDGLRAIDWLGSITIVMLTVMLLLGLDFGGVIFPWSSAKVICLIVFGIISGFLFIYSEWKVAKYPLMPLGMFSDVSTCAAMAVVTVHGMVFIAAPYFLPMYFQAVLGATPLMSGVYLLPFAVCECLGAASCAAFISKTGRYRLPMWVGLALLIIGFGLFIDLDADSSRAKMFIYQVIAGFGSGPQFQAPILALQAGVAEHDVASITAASGFMRAISMSICVVIGTVVFQNQMNGWQGRLEAVMSKELAARFSGGEANANVLLLPSLTEAQRVVARNAYAESLRSMWILYVVLAAIAGVCGLFVQARLLSKEHNEVKTGLEAEKAKSEMRALEMSNLSDTKKSIGTGV